MYAAGYAGIAVVLVLARWFTEPESDEAAPPPSH